jgi:hypothetical protein
MDLINNNYDGAIDSVKNPLMIGCSGGGGHIAAIQGIRSFLANEFEDSIHFTDHIPVTIEQKSASAARTQIEFGLKVMNTPLLKKIIQTTLSLSPIPVLPSLSTVQDEITTLSKNNSQPRKYVDMLLDAYPAGYESAAIWNVLQRDDQTEELKKLVGLQKISDQTNYHDVHDYYFNKLIEAAQNGNPFSEIISTQAMSLPALCDAVKDYNQFIKTSQLKAPSVLVHQYMTDLPTKGAIHFFNPLSSLSEEQQQQMKLYGVGMSDKIMGHFFPNGHHFSSVFNISYQENPMVRQGFYNPTLDHSRSFNQDITLNLMGENPIHLKADSKIASIMLGSQAGNDTFEYIENLINNGMDKVFVFGGKTNPILSSKINELISRHPEYKEKIIPLSNQSDKEIMPLMTRSNILVIRGGGLSVMEQLAMNHHPEQTVFIHHANSKIKKLTSGIPWEDSNVDQLIENLSSRSVHCKKTCPSRMLRHLKEARLIAAYKKYEKDQGLDISSYISQLGSKNLNIAIELLSKSERKNPPCFPLQLIMFLKNIQTKETQTLEKTRAKLSAIAIKLEERIFETFKKFIKSRSSDNSIDEKSQEELISMIEQSRKDLLNSSTLELQNLLKDHALISSILEKSADPGLKNYDKIQLIHDFYHEH